METTRVFTQIGLLNGFCHEFYLLREDWDYAKSFSLVGPFTLFEMIKIQWRLKKIDMLITVREHFTQSDSEVIWGTDIQPYYEALEEGGYISHETLTQSGDTFQEPWKRYREGVKLLKGDTPVFHMFSLWIDEESHDMNQKNIMAREMFYFSYSFGATLGNVNIRNYAEQNGEATGKRISLPFFGKTIDLYHSGSPSFKYDIDISMQTHTYQDGDFV